jgi:hypothetical protein
MPYACTAALTLSASLASLRHAKPAAPSSALHALPCRSLLNSHRAAQPPPPQGPQTSQSGHTGAPGLQGGQRSGSGRAHPGSDKDRSSHNAERGNAAASDDAGQGSRARPGSGSGGWGCSGGCCGLRRGGRGCRALNKRQACGGLGVEARFATRSGSFKRGQWRRRAGRRRTGRGRRRRAGRRGPARRSSHACDERAAQDVRQARLAALCTLCQVAMTASKLLKRTVTLPREQPSRRAAWPEPAASGPQGAVTVSANDAGSPEGQPERISETSEWPSGADTPLRSMRHTRTVCSRHPSKARH